MLVVNLTSQSISGFVYDTNGEPLSGANIKIQDTSYGTATNEEGFYRIEDLKSGDYTLVVTYLGYKEKIKLINLDASESQRRISFNLIEQAEYLSELIITSLRVGEDEPFSYVDLSREYIEERNLGQDVPFLLNHTPSVVVTSDAGAGIGYTGLRIRGSDPTRINVTINGIPYNDSESQGVFWVNLPDFASSVDDIQVQRGVGSSTNGSGAFGGSVNVGTLRSNNEPYAKLSNSIGSFNSRKHTFSLGTGLLNNRFSLDGRLSTIKSDGYIDRAASNLQSYYLSGGYYNGNTTLKAITFSGKEITYQSWWGTPQSRIEDDQEALQAHAINNGLSDSQTQNLLNSGRTYNYYEYQNEVDNYRQDHYQLHLSHETSNDLSMRAALHYTKGQGFFEQFKGDDDFEDYGLNDQNGQSSGDLILRRWLDNHYYGTVLGVSKMTEQFQLDLGTAYHIYDGDHFGQIIWGQHLQDIQKDYKYYDNTGEKKEFNIYSKLNYSLNTNFNIYADLQYRSLRYNVAGVDNDLRSLSVSDNLNFFNPKFGFNYNLNNQSSLYFSYARGSREPDRNDYVDALAGITPSAEFLNDFEMGYRQRGRLNFEANLYYMLYEDQLVPTGALNDVGSIVRINVPDSYRLGLELSAGYKLSDNMTWSTNATISRNKISEFTEVLYDYTNGFEVVENNFTDTDISFSPSLIASSTFTYVLAKNLKASLLSKYVGKQYLDNTSDENKVINAFFVNDLLFNWDLEFSRLKQSSISLQLNNLFNHLYSSNGYTYGYIFGDTITENFYYPQAGTNFMIGLTLGF